MSRPPSEGPPEERKTETTVLFVDDEPGLLDIYEIRYGSEFDVRTATDGAEAIEAFGDHVDFAFFDRRMPGMSGDEAIRTLRDRGYRTPLGIISAVDPDSDLTVECDVYLTKPVDGDRVRDAIDKYTL
jgi:CheY-like chemotaxis protein